ncbi:glycosyltransferase [Natronococcus wangiae]|uniref:glycosyltransferase n=1 Tax=Natronococcus wangiae TaxID=3068275 RepID=UPI00273ECC3C|nr:glycosyltransferase [Natronococcus sp. AD5]
MRIGLYHDNAGTKHAGGIAIYARWMAIELAASNEVYMYTQGGNITSKLIESDVKVVETPMFNGKTLAMTAKGLPVGRQTLSKFAMTTWSACNGVIDHINNHVDILVTFQMLDDLLLSNLVDVPTVRGFLSDRTPGVGAAVRERFTATEATFANTSYLAERIVDRFGYEVDAVIPTGVDTARFRPEAEPAFEQDEPTILFVGRLVESKGIFDLLESIAQLDEQVHLRIVGVGTEETAVRRRAEELGIEAQIRLEGEVPHDELPGYYVAADVFCLPTHVDSFATVNLEAMACGTPVVTTDLEGIQTYLRPEVDGLTVSPRDRKRLTTELDELIAACGYRQEMGARARNRAVEFDWSRQAELLEQFCANILSVDGSKTNESDRPMHVVN